jgi:hypothetical protein
MGVARTTLLVGPDGRVVRRWDDVKVDGHAEDVLAAVAALRPAPRPGGQADGHARRREAR